MPANSSAQPLKSDRLGGSWPLGHQSIVGGLADEGNQALTQPYPDRLKGLGFIA